MWTPKASAPNFFRLPDAFSGVVMAPGSPLAWLASWLPIMDPIIYSTTDFCAAGPPPHVSALTNDDFAGVAGSTWIDRARATLGLSQRLNAVARDQLFAQYCEIAASGLAWQTDLDIDFASGTTGNTPNDHWGYWGPGQPANVGPERHIPAGATQWRVTFTLMNAGPSQDFSNRVATFTDNSGGGRQDMAGSASNYQPPVTTMGPFTDSIGPNALYYGLLALSGMPNNSIAGHVRVEFYAPSAAVNWTPTAEPQPQAAIPYTVRGYASFQDLGNELDRQESKLDGLTRMVLSLLAKNTAATLVADAPVDAAAGVLVRPGALAFRVDLANIPAGISESFGSPTRYSRLGRATIGSSQGWLPSYDIQHNPLLIDPLPPATDRIQVFTLPPITATIIALAPPT
jgi:hypothetical protein